MDLAAAFQVPVIKDPIDNPTKHYLPPVDHELRGLMKMFLVYLSVHHPNMKVILELAIPLDQPPLDQLANLFVQGGPDGARAYRLEQ